MAVNQLNLRHRTQKPALPSSTHTVYDNNHSKRVELDNKS